MANIYEELFNKVKGGQNPIEAISKVQGVISQIKTLKSAVSNPVNVYDLVKGAMKKMRRK